MATILSVPSNAMCACKDSLHGVLYINSSRPVDKSPPRPSWKTEYNTRRDSKCNKQGLGEHHFQETTIMEWQYYRNIIHYIL